MVEPTSGVERIAAAFNSASGSAALMPYMMACFPGLDESVAVGRAYVDGGADIIELGIPYSDPLADGPVIQAAGQRALAAGATVSGSLDVAARLAPSLPLVVMCYANPVMAYGPQRFVQQLAKSGVAGLLVPDQPTDESGDLLAICDSVGVALVPLVAPTTSDERLELICPQARGFIYTVSVTGVTGERGELPTGLGAMVERIRSHTELPVAVGFGVSSPQQARSVAAIADGVIVGSRLVREVAKSESGEAAGRGGQLVAEIAAAL